MDDGLMFDTVEVMEAHEKWRKERSMGRKEVDNQG
jgi:hypothetical protein